MVADRNGRYPAADYERRLGRAAATYQVASWLVLVYRTNLLQQLGHYPSQLIPPQASPPDCAEPKPGRCVTVGDRGGRMA
jgi:hypothetical protein